MSQPLVSVITPNFNKGEFVADCMESVMNQSYENWEMIFVDDGSTDGSDEIAAQLSSQDARLIFQRNRGIKGASACRNQGLHAALGEYIMFLDSDDVLSPDCLQTRVKDAENHPEKDYLVYPMGLFQREVGDTSVISNIPTEEDPLHRFLNRDIVWLISGPFWKKETLKELDGFDESLHSQQDYDLHVRALIRGYSYEYFHRQPQVFYRQEVHSLPRLNSQTIEHFQFRFEMILRHHQMLLQADKLGEAEKLLLARYLLDLAQMMRWHIAALGREARRIGLKYWEAARERNLVSLENYKLGVKYIRFKHNMKWNRLRGVQKRIERHYRKRLGDLIFHPSKTYCRVTLEDYEA